MATAAVLPAVEGIGEGVRRSMSRQQREAQSTAVLLINVGIERWFTQRDYGTFVIPERHVWTPTKRCAVCATEQTQHDEAMDKIAEAQAKYPPKPGFRPGIGPHDFVAAPDACELCMAPKGVHAPDGRYGVLVVRGTMTAQDWGDRKKQDFPVYSDEIAQDLIREQLLGQAGVFLCRTDKPTKAELERAERIRNDRYLELVKLADADYMRYHTIHVIPDVAKRACEELIALGLLPEKREWLYAVDKTTACPRCASRVKVGVAMCVTCGAVLDREKYEAYEPPAEASAPAENPEPAKSKSKARKAVAQQ